MKVELQISETYEEEKLIVQAPQPTDKIQKVIEFAKNLDQKETIKGKIDNQVYLVKIGKIQRFYIENRKVLAETASQTYNIDLRLYQVLELLPTNFYPNFPIRNHQYRFHLSSQAHPQRPSRNFLEKRKLHLLFTPLPKNHQGEIRTMKKTNLPRRSHRCSYRPHPLYHLFTHLCTKYLRPVKFPDSLIGQMMTQHQVHGALVLLYCTLIWAAIGILFNFGKRLFSRDWSMLRATLTHFFLMLAGFVPLATLAGWFPFHWIFYLQLIIEFAIVYLIIWAILYKREAKKVDHINQLLKHKK